MASWCRDSALALMTLSLCPQGTTAVVTEWVTFVRMSGVNRTRRARRRSLPLVCALAVVLGLGACDPGDDPTDPGTTVSGETTEPTTPESSETPSGEIPTPPEVDQPVPPEEMGVDDREGAAAAAEFFFAVLDYARTTGDTRLLEALSSEDCDYCASMLDTINGLSEDGGWIRSAGFVLEDIRVQYADDGEGYLVRFVLSVPELTVFYGDGSQEVIEAATHPNFALATRWSGDGFVVDGVNPDTEA